MKPVIHHITNFVTANDCANITLAIGGLPVMANSIHEVEEITASASALVLNLGTPNSDTLAVMSLAGRVANEKNIPVVFDPVGVGASKFRGQISADLMKKVKFSVIRGNISEIKFLLGRDSKMRGVDAGIEANDDDLAKKLAQKLGCVVVVSGKVDVVSDGERNAFIENGVEMLSNITGTGCMCSSLIGYFCTQEDSFTAAVKAMTCMGIAGEMAYEKSGDLGTGSFRVALMDAISVQLG